MLINPLNPYNLERKERYVGHYPVKLAILNLMKKMRGSSDITMLVDDVIGELDAVRRKAFLDTLASSGQVIFAGTSLPESLPGDTRVLTVDAGKITPVSPV